MFRWADDDEPFFGQIDPLARHSTTQFGRFSPHARSVFAAAQVESQRYRHNYLGVEHILLGLVGESDGVAAKVLSSLTLDLNGLRSAVENMISPGEKSTWGKVDLTPRSKKALYLAVDEARRMRASCIGTEHLLIGLLLEGGGVAGTVLETLGVSVENAREATDQILGHTPSSRVSARSTKVSPLERVMLWGTVLSPSSTPSTVPPFLTRTGTCSSVLLIGAGYHLE